MKRSTKVAWVAGGAALLVLLVTGSAMARAALNRSVGGLGRSGAVYPRVFDPNAPCEVQFGYELDLERRRCDVEPGCRRRLVQELARKRMDWAAFRAARIAETCQDMATAIGETN